MTYKEIQQKQSELNKEEFICPVCGEIEKWWSYSRHGCDKAFDEYVKDTRRQEQIEEQENGKP